MRARQQAPGHQVVEHRPVLSHQAIEGEEGEPVEDLGSPDHLGDVDAPEGGDVGVAEPVPDPGHEAVRVRAPVDDGEVGGEALEVAGGRSPRAGVDVGRGDPAQRLPGQGAVGGGPRPRRSEEVDQGQPGGAHHLGAPPTPGREVGPALGLPVAVEAEQAAAGLAHLDGQVRAAGGEQGGGRHVAHHDAVGAHDPAVLVRVDDAVPDLLRGPVEQAGDGELLAVEVLRARVAAGQPGDGVAHGHAARLDEVQDTEAPGGPGHRQRPSGPGRIVTRRCGRRAHGGEGRVGEGATPGKLPGGRSHDGPGGLG